MITYIINPNWVKWLSLVERFVIGNTIKLAIERGWFISVWEGEDYAIQTSQDPNDIIAAVAQTHVTVLEFWDDEKLLGWIAFVHGNEEDVLSDYSDNEAMNKLAKEVWALLDENGGTCG